MALSDFPVRTQVPVSDIDRAAQFYEGSLGLPVVKRMPSAQIEGGGRVYASGGGAALIVYQTQEAASGATVATWFVDDVTHVVLELAASGVDFLRYDGLEHDARGVTATGPCSRLLRRAAPVADAPASVTASRRIHSCLRRRTSGSGHECARHG